MANPSIHETITHLREKFPNASFLALGQTALWDEPMKAVWRRHLDEYWPGAKLVAGVHDTDYFAKSTAHVSTNQLYALMPHNDGATRGLWSAAGELSAFLGSEDVPARAMYERYNVPFNQLAAGDPNGKASFYDANTQAWGWRGLVHTGANPPIAHDVPLAEIGDALLEQLDWGFAQSLSTIADEHRDAAQAWLTEMRDWVVTFRESCPQSATLADLYRSLLPKLYAKLLGREPSSTSFTQTMELLRFNTETCELPRFQFVENFLDPKIRRAAIAAYDSAIVGGGMYGLDTFGDGALPFDIAAPGLGRGTLRITGNAVIVDFRDRPLRIDGEQRPTTLSALAAILKPRLGGDIALVGKAVSLISMLASEFIVVFHETASGYTPRSAALNQKLVEAGGRVNVMPIVRIAYPTWDALATANIETGLDLPPHVARSFGAAAVTIPAREFGARWRAIAGAQRDRLGHLRDARSLRAALALLDDPSNDACWPCTQEQYEAALSRLKANAASTANLQAEAASLRDEIRNQTAERLRLERAKGTAFRTRIAPLQAQISTEAKIKSHLTELLNMEMKVRAADYDRPIEAARVAVRAARQRIKSLRTQKRFIERSDEALAARRQIADLTRQVQLARLSRVRDAFLTSESLPHTNSRPTAWWLPLIDPTGAWFKAIVDGTDARLESID